MKFFRPSRKNLLRATVALALASAVLTLAGAIAAERFLTVSDPIEPVNALIVLGGDRGERCERAADLFHAGLSGMIIITDVDDCPIMTRSLHRLGVPLDAIISEDRATSTRENALFTLPILRERNLTNVAIVTTWFHSRRAISTFEKYGRDIDFISTPAGKSSAQSQSEMVFAMKEYCKLGWYWLRHGVNPIRSKAR